MSKLKLIKNIFSYLDFLFKDLYKNELSKFLEDEENRIDLYVDIKINTYDVTGVEFLSYTRFILSGILKEKDLNTEIFGRISSNLLFGFKFFFPCISYVLLKDIVDNLLKIKSEYTFFYNNILVHYLSYTAPNLFFPYTQKYIDIFDIHKNYQLFNSINISSIESEKVGIVIPFYFSDNEKFKGRLEALKKNLISIQKQQYKNHLICIFINNLPENNQDDMKKILHEYKIHKIFFSNTNVGAAKGRNFCVEYLLGQETSPQYILFLDDDSLFIDDYCITKMVYGFQTDKESLIGAISPIIVHPPERDGFILDEGYEAPWQFGLDKNLLCFENKNRKISDQRKESFMLEGSCLMIRGCLLKEVGLFPEEYNYYFEEGLLGCRIKKDLGKLLVVIQNTYVLHNKIGGGGKSLHAMYYMLRNFGYFIQDLGILKDSELYKNLIKQQNEYLDMLIEEIGGGIEYKERVKKANFDLEKANKESYRPRGTDEYDIDCEIKSF